MQSPYQTDFLSLAETPAQGESVRSLRTLWAKINTRPVRSAWRERTPLRSSLPAVASWLPGWSSTF